MMGSLRLVTVNVFSSTVAFVQLDALLTSKVLGSVPRSKVPPVRVMEYVLFAKLMEYKVQITMDLYCHTFLDHICDVMNSMADLF